MGCEPNFHDDNIEKVTITIDRVEFDLKTVDKVLYSLRFEDLKEINLKGDFRFIVQLGVIFELKVVFLNLKIMYFFLTFSCCLSLYFISTIIINFF